KINAYAKRKWTNKNIHLLFQTKYVLGSYMAQRRDENKNKVFERFIEGYYPQIVSYELFNEALEAMKLRAHRKHYGNQTVGSLNIFRHSIKCDYCNASMLFEKQTNPKGVCYGYFHCFTRKELKTNCNQPRFRFDLAYGLFLELVYQATTKEDFDVHSWQSMELEEEKRDRDYVTIGGSTRLYMATPEDNEIEEKIESFRELLISLLSNKKRQAADNKKLVELRNALLEQKSYKDNLLKSFAGFTNGVIPHEFLAVVSSTELKINDIEAELSKLQAEINTRKTSINIYSENDVIELYSTEEGRLKINQFFIANDIVFRFSFEKETRTLYCKINYQGMMIDRIAKQFDLHNPLKEFGIKNLNEYFN
uniref:recombinase family protein n=1 Tax=Pseudomonas putida TaxID=303 RepID=UPI001CF66150